jgi:large subunit ribosomal protein L25
MELIPLSCSPREGRGKQAARQLRAAGHIPAVVYGHGIDETLSVAVDPKALKAALENPKGYNALLEVNVEGASKHVVLVREVQRHPVSRKFLHVDFVAPNLEVNLVSEVPVRTTGKSVGLITGGRLQTPYREVRLLSKPADIPIEILVDITSLDHGDSIMASEMSLPEGVAAVYDRDYVVTKVLKPRGEAEEETAAEAEDEDE